VLVGGDGDDILKGSSKRDVLIGGLGHDRIFGARNTDWLVSGHTAYDLDPAALAAIAAEWNSRRPAATRLANFRSGDSPILESQHVRLEANLTLFEDGDVPLFAAKGRRGRG
jgi:Ca2+-binding RTX toxin-like protein